MLYGDTRVLPLFMSYLIMACTLIGTSIQFSRMSATACALHCNIPLAQRVAAATKSGNDRLPPVLHRQKPPSAA